MNSYDVIVIGLGAMGSASVYQLAKRGARVLGIDQYSPPHTLGSSHGDTRITRQAIGEGEAYVPLVLRSYDLWREIEKEVSTKLLFLTGGLIMSNAKKSNFFNQTVRSAEKFNISHRLLSADLIQERFPQFKLQGGEKGYFEENAGYLVPELCIKAQLGLSKNNGADLYFNKKVTEILPTQSSVIVKTESDIFYAKKIILSVGPWITSFLEKEYSLLFKIYRQVLFWFDVNGSRLDFDPAHFPVWIWEFGDKEEDAMYGFPAINGKHGGIKLATEQYVENTMPEIVKRNIIKEEQELMYSKYVRPYFNGVYPICIKSSSCLYTVTPDHNFIIDTHPKFENVLIASPCSGHGFKHSAAIGEVLAELVMYGKSKIDVSSFKIERFGRTTES